MFKRIQRHEVLIYLVLVFVISVGGILPIVGPGSLPLKVGRFVDFGPFLCAAILEGPCVAGILLTMLFSWLRPFHILLVRTNERTHWRLSSKPAAR